MLEQCQSFFKWKSDLYPTTSKHKLVRGFVIPNICVKAYDIWLIKVTQVMTKMTKVTHSHTQRTNPIPLPQFCSPRGYEGLPVLFFKS